MERQVDISPRVTLFEPSGRLRVRLSEAEEWQLRQINEWRQATHLDTPDPKIARGRDGKGLSLQGVRAEYAVARVLGVPMDMCSNLDRDLVTADLYLDDGVSVQVKSRRKIGWPLLFHPVRYPFKADYAVLCYARADHEGPVYIAGYIGREEFSTVAEEFDIEIGPQPGVLPAALHPVLDLRSRHVAWCKSCGQRKPPTGEP